MHDSLTFARYLLYTSTEVRVKGPERSLSSEDPDPHPIYKGGRM